NLLRRQWRSERRRLDAYARSGARGASELSGPLAAELAAAVKALPRREREPLLLLAWGDLSYEDIARALDIPVGTVRSRISRSRATAAAARAGRRLLRSCSGWLWWPASRRPGSRSPQVTSSTRSGSSAT